MFPILFVAALWILGMFLNGITRNMLSRFSFGFEQNKPYPHPPVDKPSKPHKPRFQHLMARVKYAGTGAMAISGKIGGTVFSNSGVMGPFVRNWAKPRNSRTAFTTLVRGVFSGISSAYKTLTSVQLNSWIAAVGEYTRKNVFGDLKNLTPNEIFQRVNNILDSLGLSTVVVAPAVVATDSVTALTGAASVGGATFTLSPTLFSGGVALPANTYARVYATKQVSSSINSFSKSKYRLIGFFNPAAAIPFSIFTDYTNRFGGLALGTKISLAIELVYFDSVPSPSNFSKTGLVYATVIVAA